jgi:hypothetical protein
MAKRQANSSASNDGGESIAGYFRKIFDAQPRLLRKRSNKKLLEMWMADHPGHSEVPASVKNSLSNLKSVLRSKRRRRRRAKEQIAGAVAVAKAAPVLQPTGARGLEALEIQIDDCLSYAKHLDRDGLADVIGWLRRARNTVVWKSGQ